MKKALIMALATIFAVSCSSTNNNAPAIEADAAMERRIDDILSTMTLEEKVGQMTQITVDVITNFEAKGEFTLSEAKLDTVIRKYKVGSILNVPLSVAQTPEVWDKTIRRLQEVSLETMGIPCIYGVDQIHGTTYTVGGTMFPQGINMAATFNRDLMRESSKISAYETRGSAIPWTFAPVMDLGRDPRWSRMWESYGEDAYVNAEMAVASIEGFQGDDPNNIGMQNVAACAKHFLGYGVPVSGKDRTPSSISDIDMREKHFAPFLASLRAGVLTLMVNSGINNGVPFHANTELLTTWVKEDLNWDGLIVTDWADINNICTRDRVAVTKKEAVKMAINAGIDMSMVPYEVSFCDYLLELVEEGEVSMSRIDDAVRRVLRLKMRLGLFENPYWDIAPYREKFGCAEHAAVALEAAEESIVLLKNENNILPLAKGKKILVTGPNANTMRGLNGGWSYSWQGHRADEFTAEHNTIYEALREQYGEANVTLEEGVSYDNSPKAEWWQELQPEIKRAVRAARTADVIVACVGENSYCETPGNLTDLTLSKNQTDLIKALSATGKPIILILNEGRPRIIKDLVPLVDGVVNVMLPSNSGGDALARLMAGEANFSGKLPFTYPRHINSIATYDYKPCENIGQMGGNYNYDSVMDVEWEFGAGLSYTDYEYSNLRVTPVEFTADDTITVTVDVKNIGKVRGKESVLLFVSDLYATISPDNRRLREFEKVELAPNESKEVKFTLKGSDLAFVGADKRWRIEKGEFVVMCGDERQSINAIEDRVWTTPNI